MDEVFMWVFVFGIAIGTTVASLVWWLCWMWSTRYPPFDPGIDDPKVPKTRSLWDKFIALFSFLDKITFNGE